MDATLEDVRNRLKVGLVPPNDVLSVEAQRSRQQMLLIQARNTARAGAGRPAAPHRRARRTRRSTVDAQLEAAPPAGGRGAAARGRGAEGAARPAGLEARVAGRRRAPRGGGGRQAAGRSPWAAGVDFARPNPRFFPRTEEWKASWDAGVNFTWTFWDCGRVQADVARAAAAERAVARAAGRIRQPCSTSRCGSGGSTSSRRARRIVAADDCACAPPPRRGASSSERYAAGVATSTEVLDAQVALLQAGLDRTQALANVRLAEARLERALGR